MTTLVYILGGLGASQVDDIVAAVSVIPSVVVAPSAAWNGWLTRIAESARVCPSDLLVLIGHSFGGDTVWRACDDLAVDGRRVDLLIGLDEVDSGGAGSGDIKRPETMPRAYKRFRAAISFPVRPAPMEWSVWEQVPGTDHNSLCHNQHVIDPIVELVKAVAAGSPVGV